MSPVHVLCYLSEDIGGFLFSLLFCYLRVGVFCLFHCSLSGRRHSSDGWHTPLSAHLQTGKWELTGSLSTQVGPRVMLLHRGTWQRCLVENPRVGISRVSLGLFPRSILVLRESSSSCLPGGVEPGSES